MYTVELFAKIKKTGTNPTLYHSAPYEHFDEALVELLYLIQHRRRNNKYWRIISDNSDKAIIYADTVSGKDSVVRFKREDDSYTSNMPLATLIGMAERLYPAQKQRDTLSWSEKERRNDLYRRIKDDNPNSQITPSERLKVMMAAHNGGVRAGKEKLANIMSKKNKRGDW